MANMQFHESNGQFRCLAESGSLLDATASHGDDELPLMACCPVLSLCNAVSAAGRWVKWGWTAYMAGFCLYGRLAVDAQEGGARVMLCAGV